jgi:hypothetical protein
MREGHWTRPYSGLFTSHHLWTCVSLLSTKGYIMALTLFRSSFLSSLNTSSFFNVTAVSQPVMYSVSSILFVCSLAFQAVFSHPSRVVRDEIVKRSVDTFIATESPIALRDLLCNIGSAGACVSGTASGLVIASPDRTSPNCKFTSDLCRFDSHAE